MEWTCETGEVVTWTWSQPSAGDAGDVVEAPYAIRIHIDGRRLRGAESKRWKQRIEEHEFPAA